MDSMTGPYIILAAWGLLMTIAGFLLKGKIDAYDKHLEECNAKRTEEGGTAEKISKLEKHAEKMDESITWVGDCLITIGATMKVNLPNRP